MPNKNDSRENRPPPSPPLNASDINASVELTPAERAPVQKKVPQADAVDIQRYLRWADQLLKPKQRAEEDGSDDAHPKAA